MRKPTLRPQPPSRLEQQSEGRKAGGCDAEENQEVGQRGKLQGTDAYERWGVEGQAHCRQSQGVNQSWPKPPLKRQTPSEWPKTNMKGRKGEDPRGSSSLVRADGPGSSPGIKGEVLWPPRKRRCPVSFSVSLSEAVQSYSRPSLDQKKERQGREGDPLPFLLLL